MSCTAAQIQANQCSDKATPPESPEVTAARARYNEAGYARNRAEATYSEAKKEHGADSAEAKAAHEQLQAAQANVEQAQKELKDALQIKKAAPRPAPAPATPSKTEPPQPSEVKLAPVRSEFIRRAYIHEIILDHPDLERRVQEYLKRLQKDPNKAMLLEEIRTPANSEMLIRRAEFFRVQTPAKQP